MRPEGGEAFHLDANHLQTAEWHNLQASCSTFACPASTYRQDNVVNGPMWNVSTGMNGFAHLEFMGENAFYVQGSPRLLLIGGEHIDLFVNGSLRLPKTAGTTSCMPCTNDGATLAIAGSVVFSNLHASAGNRLEGTFGGEVTTARLDEVGIDPAQLMSTISVAAATVAAATVIVLMKTLLSALFTRLSGEEALEHPNRKRLMEYITKDPGINFRGLVRASGIAAGTARHHLTIMVRAGVVTEQGFGATRRFFAGAAGGNWEHKVLMREPGLRQVYDWVATNPGATQMQVLDAMAGAGWSRSTTQHRLLRLSESGALQVRWQGRYKRYWTDGTKVPAEALARAGPGAGAPATG